MKFRVKMMVAGLLSLFCLSHFAIAGSGFSGQFVVGPHPGTDYQSLADALQDIEQQGMGDHIELYLTPGEHTTHVTINTINRTGNPNARLLITSEDESNPAVLVHTPLSAAENWIIKLNQVEKVDLVAMEFEIKGTRDLTTAIVFEQSASDISIVSNVFTAYEVRVHNYPDQISLISQTDDVQISDLSVIDNQFISGGAVMYLTSSQGSQGLDSIVIEDNIMLGQTLKRSTELIYLSNSRDVSIQRNQISSDSDLANGILLFYTDGLVFSQNSIHFSERGQFGLSLLAQNNFEETQTIVSNNFFHTAQFGIQLYGSHESVSVLNNTILLSGPIVSGSTAFSAVIQSNSTDVDEVTLRGNILINLSTAAETYILDVSNSNIINESDHNVMYDADGGSFLLDDTLFNTLADYQLGIGLDNASLFRNVDFVDAATGDLHLTESMLADHSLLIPANPNVIRDIDGYIRDTNLHRAGADDAEISDVLFASGFEG